MSGNSINMDLNVQDQGGTLKSRTKEAKDLNKELEKAQKLSGKTFAAQSSERAAYGTAGMVMTEQEYRKARGTAGKTGAGARDFAAQARGLDGLVRLYATWAANVYALGAAFSALSKAADTDNMIQGMNQLGASSGVALGALAKQFVDITGGAISFKDAIGATTKAISAGLSTSQFKAIGEVAAKASRALGVDMSDAVSRLTRGITKIEPELLDELGLFTKVGPAAEEYAKRVGKSAASLSDFEKRQAFANAVLKEGKDKFAEINVAPNPYDKLSASIQDLTQKGLSLINVVLSPIISLLSSSPVALTGVLAGLGVMLLKQAIPAIGEYRKSLDASADAATKKWEAKANAVKKIEKDQYQYLLNLSEQQAEAKLKSFEKAEARLSKARGKSVLNEKAQEILGKQDFKDITSSDIKYLRDTAKIEKSAGNTQLAKEYREAANALKQWIKAEQDHLNLQKQVAAQVDVNVAKASKLTATGYAREQLESARKSKARSGILSGVAEDVSIGTFGEAWAKMNKKIDTEKLTGLDKVFTKVGGAAVIATTAVTRVVSALSGVLGWVGAAIGTLTTLYGWVSTNRQEEEKLSQAIEYAAEVTKTATATFAKFENTLTAQSLLAKSNAMGALGDSIEEAASKFADFDKASGFIDRTWESVKHLFGLFGGFSKQDLLADSMSKQVMLMLDNIDDPELKKKAEIKLKGLLNVPSLSLDSVRESIASMDPKNIKEIPKALEEVPTKAKATTAAMTALKDGFKDVDSAFLALSNTLISQDPMQKFAQAIASQAKNMAEAFKDPQTAVVTFGEILKDNSKLQMFPPEARAEILAQASAYKTLTQDIEDNKAKLVDAKKTMAEWMGSETGYNASVQVRELQVKIKADTQALTSFGKTLQDASAKAMEFAFNIATKKFNSALQQAGLDVQKTAVGLLPKSVGTVKLQMDLELKSIKIREQEITAIYNLTQEYKKQTATQAVKSAEETLAKAKPGTKEYTEAEAGLKTAQSNLKALNDPNLAQNKDKYEKTPEVFNQLQLQSGYSAQMATLLNQAKSVRVKGAVDTFTTQFEEGIRAAQDTVNLETKKFEEKLASKGESITLEQKDTLKQEYLDATRAAREKIALAEPAKSVGITETVQSVATKFGLKDVAAVAGTDLPEWQKRLDIAKQDFDLSEKKNRQLDATALLQAQVTRDYSRQDVLAQQALDTAKLAADQDSKAVESAQQMLDLQSSLGLIDAQSYETRTNALKARKIEIDYVSQILDIEEERRKKLATINEEIAKAGGREKVEPTRLAQLDADTQVIQQRYRDQRAGIDSVIQGMRDQNALADSMSVRMKGMGQIIEGTFQKMGDALADFVKTGKFNFKSLITDMLVELLRFEYRAQMTTIYSGLGGLKGILGAFMQPSMTIDTAGVGMGSIGSVDTASMAAGTFRAKGAAYDIGGIERFAKGGTFTNSVVSSPTLFKFAKGTGMMGEAGPEAIMPLKRDSNGNLGVRAQQQAPQTSVVVNNYGSEKATTQETTDSKGNRKIEVIIGDAVAHEVARTGSATQQAMSSTFGNRPALARR